MKKETKEMTQALGQLIKAANDFCEDDEKCNLCDELTICLKNIRKSIATLAEVLDQLFLRIDSFISIPQEDIVHKPMGDVENYYL